MNNSSRQVLVGSLVGALGVVFGDIGTSPLYAIRQCFSGSHPMDPTQGNVMGVLSLIFWSLVIIVSVKYLGLVMRAENKGEGGILALLVLAFPSRKRLAKNAALFGSLGVFGAALLYGDGMITPAISVLGAMEGLELATPAFKPYILPATTIILIGLFTFQRVGTGNVGNIFGPIMLSWFVTIAVLGIKGIALAPEVLLSANPLYAVRFFLEHSYESFVLLGSVVLVVTGAEALYADMGHFGIRPIRVGWFTIVLPALFLNYLGQGALLLKFPEAKSNPFFSLAPRWGLYPLIGLATMAAVIASQALISGAFSLTMHAMQLGYMPRMEIQHTSSARRGQIYLPVVNWILMVCCIGLVLGFGSSSNLAAAYGIAVTLTMIITTVLFYFAVQRLWKWKVWQAALVCGVFLSMEVSYFAANILKITHGGWFPLVAGGCIYLLMSTWQRGRAILWERLRSAVLPFATFLEDARVHRPLRVPGTAIFMSGNPNGTPLALLHHLKHSKVLHERVIVLTLYIEEVPHVTGQDQVEVEDMHDGFWRVTGRYGFMETPDISDVLQKCKAHGLALSARESTFFLSRETIVATTRPGLARWRKRIFAIMARNAQPATAFFRLPADRVVELGMLVEL